MISKTNLVIKKIKKIKKSFLNYLLPSSKKEEKMTGFYPHGGVS